MTNRVDFQQKTEIKRCLNFNWLLQLRTTDFTKTSKIADHKSLWLWWVNTTIIVFTIHFKWACFWLNVEGKADFQLSGNCEESGQVCEFKCEIHAGFLICALWNVVRLEGLLKY